MREIRSSRSQLFYKKGVFCEFCDIFKNTFFTKPIQTTAWELDRKYFYYQWAYFNKCTCQLHVPTLTLTLLKFSTKGSSLKCFFHLNFQSLVCTNSWVTEVNLFNQCCYRCMEHKLTWTKAFIWRCPVKKLLWKISQKSHKTHAMKSFLRICDDVFS